MASGYRLYTIAMQDFGGNNRTTFSEKNRSFRINHK